MDVDTAAKCLAELGNPARLTAYRLLVRAGDDGLTVGEIQRALDMPASTLSHHIAHLVAADLITQRREGRTQRCHARYATMDALLAFLTRECCVGGDAALAEPVEPPATV
jgi:DNA-binding transcriptional ArsR family regulator